MEGKKRVVDGGGDEKGRGSNSITILCLCLFYGQSFKQAPSASFANFLPRLHDDLKKRRKIFCNSRAFATFRQIKGFSFHDLLRNEK